MWYHQFSSHDQRFGASGSQVYIGRVFCTFVRTDCLCSHQDPDVDLHRDPVRTVGTPGDLTVGRCYEPPPFEGDLVGWWSVFYAVTMKLF